MAAVEPYGMGMRGVRRAIRIYVVAIGIGTLVVISVKLEAADQLGSALPGAVTLATAGAVLIHRRRQEATGGASELRVLAETVKRELGDRRRRLLGDFGIGATHTVNVTFRRVEGPQLPLTSGVFTAARSYYESVPDGRLVITGGPGAGKTMLAAELVLAILEGRAVDDPVPVRLPLSDWDASNAPPRPDAFARWLQGRLVDEYALTPPTARALVSAHRIVPVLDGLDEMDPDDAEVEGTRAASVLRALDLWIDGRKGVPFVLTCRTEWYDRLAEAGLALSGVTRVELDKVSPAKAAEYLRRISKRHPERWDSLFRELETNPTGPLATALDSPWRLTMTAVVYADDGDPGDLLRSPDAESLRGHLLAHYVPAASRTHPDAPASGYSADAVHAWLAWIAVRLGTRGEFAPVHMWRLAPTNRVLGVEAILAAAPWLLLTALCVFGAQSNSPVGVLAILLGFTAGFQAAHHIRTQDPPPTLVVVHYPRNDSRRVLRDAGWYLLVVLIVIGLVALVLDGPTRAYIGREFADGWSNPELPSAVSPWQALLLLLTLTAAGPVMIAILITALTFLPVFALGRAVRLVPSDESPRALRDPRFPLVYQLRLAILAPSLSVVLVALTPGTVAERLLLFLFCSHALLLTGSPAVPRYAAFRLCTRGQVPPRLPEFLHWARGAGLLRLSGSSYEFRHRELQDWLAANPTPTTA